MNPGWIVLLPLLLGCTLPWLRQPGLAARVNAAGTTLVFCLAWFLPRQPDLNSWWFSDRLAVHFTVLTTFIGCTSAWYSIPYIERELRAGRLDNNRARVYHACFPFFLGAVLLAVLSGNPGLTCIGIELATLAGALVVALPRSEDAMDASWKYVLLCGVGVALALFGTAMLALAAHQAPGGVDLAWPSLMAQAAHLPGTTLNLAFAFLLVGYGTKAALVPLHNWMPDAHTEGPTPVSAVLSASVMNAALLIILRLKMLMDANRLGDGGAIDAGPVIAVLGLLSVMLGAFNLWRRRAVKRFFAFSTLEQNGVAATAIGLGAFYPALLHITFHTLAKAGLFQAVGVATQQKNQPRFSGLSGLLTDGSVGWLLAAGMIAISGLPPFGLFTSEFLVITQTAHRMPILALPLGLGLLAGGWAMIVRLQSLLLGPHVADAAPRPPALMLAPAWLHMTLVVILGLALPGVFGVWMRSLTP